MIDALINGFDDEVFGRFLNSKFSGSFSASRSSIPVKKDFGWERAEQLGIVKTLVGPHGANMPMLVVAVKLHDGEMLKERSSRIKQFKFAKQELDDAMSNPAPGVDGVLSQGLFVFHDEEGNFRLSLVFGKAEGTKLVWSTAKRLSFYVEAGAGNKTFRDRLALDWSSFDKLKEAFSVEKLTREFYTRLFAWYQRAMDSDEVVFPNDIVKDKEPGEVKSEQIIRMITRLMFVWFLKQKHLVPNNIFDPAELKTILRKFDELKGDDYYRAILQNLFFATLNTEISDREFAVEGNREENEEHFGVKILYRYASAFALSEEEVIKLFGTIPFMNGGLFECLDKEHHYYDGFSRRKGKRAQVPNALFFDDKGLIPLLQQYNFTVEENSPGDEEVALDPEMLGKVFENLLGAYNPETKAAARNATGSFYTPREIVNYMVDESLVAHLTTKCGEDNAEIIRKLFAEGECPADKKLCKALDESLVSAKILDPACGSGAFPMGILLRMVELLRILRNIPEEDSVYDLKLELIKNCIYGGDIQCIAVQISKLRFFISLVCEQKPTKKAKDNYGIHTLPNLETKFVSADSLIGLPEAGKDVLELCTGDIAELKEQLFDVRSRHFSARSYPQKKELRKEDRQIRAKIKRMVKRDAKPDRKHLDLLIKEREKVAEPKWSSEKQKPQSDEMFTEFSGVNESSQGLFDENAKKRKQLDSEIAREQKKVNLPTTEVDQIAEMLASWDPYDQNASASFSDPEWMFNVSEGFDVVLGNPPYVQIQNFSGQKCQKQWQEQGFKTFAKTGDIYCLFYERGYGLLRPGGMLSFITSNKWMRAGYGKAMREYVLENGQMGQLIDFGDSPVFEEATTYTNILFWSKTEESKHPPIVYDLNAVYADDTTLNEMLLSAGSDKAIFTEHSFVIAGKAQARIKQRIEQIGTPLKEWDVEMIYGIKTGCNEAFIISGDKKDELIAADPNSANIIKPILRGRDIKRYQEHFADLWMISAFPALNLDIDDYPAVRDYLKNYGKRLEQTGKPGCRKKTNNKWFEVQDSISYFEEFGKEKLLYAEIVFDSAFFYDNHDFYPEATTFMMTGESLKYLAALLNSKLLTYAFKHFYAGGDLRGNTFRYKKVFLNQLPLPKIEKSEQQPFEILVDKIQALKKGAASADTSSLEAEIDQLVYQLYSLTKEEIAIVEASVQTKTPASAKATADKEAGDPKSVKKKPVRKRKAKLPPSLPGWD